MSYLETTHELYKEAALAPQANLCCVAAPPPALPGLVIPDAMYETNYGCGTTVHLQDLRPEQDILYVGVGGGLEALQFAYVSRRTGAVIAVDRVPEMLALARRNLDRAAAINTWFRPEFVRLEPGDALALPVEDAAVDIAAQNCLFNIFEGRDLDRALAEMKRVLHPSGRLYISDPVATRLIPPRLQADERLRAMCLTGALPLEDYLERITAAGFGTVEVRSRRPYRLLDRQHYGLEEHLLLEAVELVAYNTPVPADGPCVFVGETAIYSGLDETFDDGKGHRLLAGIPAPVCRKTAAALARLNRDDIVVTLPTWHYGGGGCC